MNHDLDKLIAQNKRFARALLALDYEISSDARCLYHIEQAEPIVEEAMELLNVSSFSELKYET